MPEVTDKDREHIGLPKPIFTYTVDQICTMLQIPEVELFKKYLWLTGREYGHRPLDMVAAVNISPVEDTPVWRVEETEFVRWCKRKKFRTFIREFGMT